MQEALAVSLAEKESLATGNLGLAQQLCDAQEASQRLQQILRESQEDLTPVNEGCQPVEEWADAAKDISEVAKEALFFCAPAFS